MTLATPGVLSDGVSVELYSYSASFAGVIGSDGTRLWTMTSMS